MSGRGARSVVSACLDSDRRRVAASLRAPRRARIRRAPQLASRSFAHGFAMRRTFAASEWREGVSESPYHHRIWTSPAPADSSVQEPGPNRTSHSRWTRCRVCTLTTTVERRFRPAAAARADVLGVGGDRVERDLGDVGVGVRRVVDPRGGVADGGVRHAHARPSTVRRSRRRRRCARPA